MPWTLDRYSPAMPSQKSNTHHHVLHMSMFNLLCQHMPTSLSSSSFAALFSSIKISSLNNSELIAEDICNLRLLIILVLTSSYIYNRYSFSCTLAYALSCPLFPLLAYYIVLTVFKNTLPLSFLFH